MDFMNVLLSGEQLIYRDVRREENESYRDTKNKLAGSMKD